MANWDFDCPQFVDFSADLDRYADVDCIGVSSNGLSAPVENREETYGPKMATPRIKTIVDLRNSPFVNKSRAVRTDDEKMAKTLGKMSSRLSKSDGFFDEIVPSLQTPQNRDFLQGSPRRFTSEFRLKKKRLCPKTPVCLKRTLLAKLKKAKTTEELELDTIADLQNKLQQQLKLNKINLKRLKNNKALFPLSKVLNKNNRQVKDMKGRKLEALRNPFQYPTTSDNRNAHHQSQAGSDMPVPKELHAHEHGLVNKLQQLNAVLKEKAPQTNALCDVNNIENNTNKNPKRRGLFHLENAHGGLKILSKQKQTVPLKFSQIKMLNSGTTQKTILQIKENLKK